MGKSLFKNTLLLMSFFVVFSFSGCEMYNARLYSGNPSPRKDVALVINNLNDGTRIRWIRNEKERITYNLALETPDGIPALELMPGEYTLGVDYYKHFPAIYPHPSGTINGNLIKVSLEVKPNHVYVLSSNIPSSFYETPPYQWQALITDVDDLSLAKSGLSLSDKESYKDIANEYFNSNKRHTLVLNNGLWWW